MNLGNSGLCAGILSFLAGMMLVLRKYLFKGNTDGNVQDVEKEPQTALNKSKKEVEKHYKRISICLIESIEYDWEKWKYVADF